MTSPIDFEGAQRYFTGSAKMLEHFDALADAGPEADPADHLAKIEAAARTFSTKDMISGLGIIIRAYKEGMAE